MILTVSGISKNASEDFETLFELLRDNDLSGDIDYSESGLEPEDEHADIALDDDSTEYIERDRDILLKTIAEWLEEAGYELVEVDGDRHWDR